MKRHDRGGARRPPRREDAKKKAARDKILATKTIEKGLLIVHTGKGKGKSTAAFGMVFRALGHGMPVGDRPVRQGQVADRRARRAGEVSAISSSINTMGEGFTWETQDRQRDIAAARAAWERAKAMIMAGKHSWCCSTNSTSCCATTICRSPRWSRSCATRSRTTSMSSSPGATPPDELIEIADLVTEMEMVKHPFRSGVKAQEGVEF